MKKILFVVMAMVAVSFASCTKNAVDAPAATDTDSVSVDTVEVVDTLVADSICLD